MVTRADAITQTQKTSVIFSDYTLSFLYHPVTKELIVVKNEEAVKQAIRNCILTAVGERFFSPFFGSNIYKSLFEPFSPFFAEDLLKYITLSIAQFEPRCQLLNVTPIVNEDANEVSVNIVFSLINSLTPVSFNVFLRRVR